MPTLADKDMACLQRFWLRKTPATGGKRERKKTARGNNHTARRCAAVISWDQGMIMDVLSSNARNSGPPC